MWQKLFLLMMVSIFLCDKGSPKQANLVSSMIDDSVVCRPLLMTCTLQNLTSLNWYFDGERIVTYSFSTAPVSIYNAKGVNINVLEATRTDSSDSFSAISVLNTTTLAATMLGVNNISCGTYSIRSQAIDITVLNVGMNYPPSTSVGCSLTATSNAVDASIQWSSSFTSLHSVERYNLSVSPDPSSCSSNHVSPSEDYTCSGLAQGTSYNFTVGAIVDCGSEGQEGDHTSFIVVPQAPQIADNISTLLPTYDQNSTLSALYVQWIEKPQLHISQNCTFNQLNYTLSLLDSMGVIVQERVISSHSCRNGFCNTTFSDFTSIQTIENYYVSIMATNGVNELSNNATSDNIAASVMDIVNVTFTSANCSIFVECISPETNSGSCSVQFGQNKNLFNPPIQTLLNSPITLSLMALNAIYFYEVTVTINSSLTFLIIGNFSSAPPAVRLTSTDLFLLVIGIMIFFVASAFAVILAVTEVKSKKGSWLSLILLVLGIVLIVVCVGLWCAVVVPQDDDTCDSSWQSSRGRLLIIAHALSDLALTVLFSAAAMLCVAVCGLCNNMEHNKTLKDHNNDLKAILVDEHAEIGMNVMRATNMTASEKESEYETTTHTYGVKKPQKDTYSHLDRSKVQGKGEGDAEKCSVINAAGVNGYTEVHPGHAGSPSSQWRPFGIISDIYEKLKQEFTSKKDEESLSKESMVTLSIFASEANDLLYEHKSREIITREQALVFLKKHGFNHKRALDDVCKIYCQDSSRLEKESQRTLPPRLSPQPSSQPLTQPPPPLPPPDIPQVGRVEGKETYSTVNAASANEYTEVHPGHKSSPPSQQRLLGIISDIYEKLKQEFTLKNDGDSLSEESIMTLNQFSSEANSLLLEHECDEIISREHALEFLKKHGFNQKRALDDIRKIFCQQPRIDIEQKEQQKDPKVPDDQPLGLPPQPIPQQAPKLQPVTHDQTIHDEHEGEKPYSHSTRPHEAIEVIQKRAKSEEECSSINTGGTLSPRRFFSGIFDKLKHEAFSPFHYKGRREETLGLTLGKNVEDLSEESKKTLFEFSAEANSLLLDHESKEIIDQKQALKYLKKHDFNPQSALNEVRRHFCQESAKQLSPSDKEVQIPKNVEEESCTDEAELHADISKPPQQLPLTSMQSSPQQPQSQLPQPSPQSLQASQNDVNAAEISCTLSDDEARNESKVGEKQTSSCD